MKIRHKLERGEARSGEPFNTQLLLLGLALALVDCFLFLRTTGPPGLERALPAIGLAWFSVQALCCAWLLARQLIRERLSPKQSTHGFVVTLGDLSIVIGIIGEVIGIVLLVSGVFGTLH